MASGTITGATGNQYIDSRIVWSSTATQSSNTSNVTATLQYKRNNSGYTTSGTGSFSITIDGTKTSVSKTLTITENAWVTAVSATKTVTHSSDGTKSITISGTGSISGTSLTSTSCSGTAKLDTIPRASTISYASNVTLGNICTVRWTPHSKTFYYKIKFAVGNWSLTTVPIYPNTTSLYTNASYGIAIDAAKQFPNSKTAEMKVTLYTYTDKDCTKQIGSASTYTCTVSIPENDDTRPSVTMGLSAVHTLGSTFSSLYIQGKSRVKATFSGGGKYGATITSYTLRVAGKNYPSPYESDVLFSSGKISVVGTATDSRGLVTSVPQEIYVIPYTKPALVPYTYEKEIVCKRCNKDGTITPSGTYLRIKGGRKYSKVISDGTQKNFCILRFRYKTEGATYPSSWTTLLSKDSSTTDVVDAVTDSAILSTTTSYKVQVGVVDDVGETSTLEFSIPTAQVTFHLKNGGKGASFGKYAESDNCLDIAEDWELKVRGVLHAQHIGEISSYSYADFNELVYDTGYYTGTSAPSAVSATNYPINETGVLEVISAMAQNKETLAWWGFAYQTYRTHTGLVYMRSYFTSSGWTAWKKVTLT